MNSAKSNNQSFKCLKFSPSGCTDIGNSHKLMCNVFSGRYLDTRSAAQAELCLHFPQKVQYTSFFLKFLLYSLEAIIHYCKYYYYYFEIFRLGLLRPSPLSRSVSRCSQINNTLRELRTQQTNILTLHNLHILYTMYIIQHPSIFN